MFLKVITPHKLISHENAIYVNFILLSRATYFFPDFPGSNNICLKFFCTIKTYSGVLYPPKIFFIKLTKSHISSLIVRIFFELV